MKREVTLELIEDLPEIMRALTPMFLAFIGGAIGISVLLTDSTSEKTAAGIGLAGTAITGAAGLAQSTKKEPSTQKSAKPQSNNEAA